MKTRGHQALPDGLLILSECCPSKHKLEPELDLARVKGRLERQRL
jgi:hypothetical protein